MRRIEPAAVLGVMSREVANFRTFWRSTTFPSLIEPLIYLLAFGLGLGTTLVTQVGDVDYVEFVGTGIAMANASARLQAAATAHCRDVKEDGIYWYCVENGLI